MAVSLAFAGESETIAFFEYMGIPGIEGPNNRVSFDLTGVEDVADTLFNKTIEDLIENKDETLSKLFADDLGEKSVNFGKVSNTIGVSVYHFWDGKKYCDCENCTKKHKQKRHVFGGNIGLFISKTDSAYINGDLFVGRSFINNDYFKLLLLYVLGFNATVGSNVNDCVSPETGMEIDFILSPFTNANHLRFIVGCRGLVGCNFMEKPNPEDGKKHKHLYTSIQPKVGIGCSF